MRHSDTPYVNVPKSAVANFFDWGLRVSIYGSMLAVIIPVSISVFNYIKNYNPSELCVVSCKGGVAFHRDRYEGRKDLYLTDNGFDGTLDEVSYTEESGGLEARHTFGPESPEFPYWRSEYLKWREEAARNALWPSAHTHDTVGMF